MRGERRVVAIERLVTGGDGLVREVGGDNAGRVVFVPGTVPGDQVEIDFVEERRRFARGRVVRVLASGPGRVEPQCPLVGRCGGCPWQHVAPSLQRSARVGFVEDALRRLPRGEPLPVSASLSADDSPELSRDRVRVHIAPGRDGVRVGFRAARSHELVDVPRCPVASEAVNEALARLREALRPLRNARGSAVIVAGDTGPAAVSLWLDGAASLPDIEWPSETTRAVPTADGGSVALRVSAAAFAQASMAGNRALVSALLARWGALPGHGGPVAELFAGGGNLTVPIAMTGASVLAIESAAAGVADLRHNAEQAGVQDRIDVVEGDARGDDVASRLRALKPSIVLLDPPREGARELVPVILDVAPSAVVYVSCDPATLGRDLTQMAEGGYVLREAIPFHMFAQTPHVETLTLLTRMD